MRIYIICLTSMLFILAGSAHSQEIVDLYSSIDSADITVAGDLRDQYLLVDLIFNGRIIDFKMVNLSGPGTYVVRWSRGSTIEGSYDVCARLSGNEGLGRKLGSADEFEKSKNSEKCLSFYWGGIRPMRFDVRDFRADSRGMHLSISASDPVYVDIYYMLFSGNKAVYVTREKDVSISGGFLAPVQKDFAWKQILNASQEYSGRVKIIELSHNQTRSFMNSFLAREDAMITETYQDETGASATVMGNSRVPFEGDLQFVLSRNGTILYDTKKETPVLLADDDETVEISWNKTLVPGLYLLRTVLIDSGGNVLDLAENVIEAEPIVRINSTETKKESPASFVSNLAALLAAAVFCRRKISVLSRTRSFGEEGN